MFNLADYETVEVRLEKFIKEYADFRIATELEVVEKDRYIVKAYLYKTASDSVAWATGYAEEKITDRGVNATSALESQQSKMSSQMIRITGQRQ
jgi:predicted metalloprotease with PDZ domain